MKVLSYIPIALFIIVNTVYDFFYIPKSTNWSIFYFAGIYISLFIWVISEAIKDDNGGRVYYVIMAIGLLLRIIAELQKIGMDYDKYMISINDYQQSLLFASWVIASLTILVVQLWRKYR
jgi:hypothetical protein